MQNEMSRQAYVWSVNWTEQFHDRHGALVSMQRVEEKIVADSYGDLMNFLSNRCGYWSETEGAARPDGEQVTMSVGEITTLMKGQVVTVPR